ncbi:hypothetical protein HanPI659440_Chr07g0258711 [Helianthus annuus]|nr:hypothetical protein HanPI659440_Chr07g0258711 [Helianthus annuus]
MLELRSGLRHARASSVVVDKTRTKPTSASRLLGSCVKTRTAAAREAAAMAVEVKRQKNKKKKRGK